MTRIQLNEMNVGTTSGRVHSFDSFGTVDGPGTRFVVFLQGCLFRCKYCHNRDTWDLDAGKLYTVQELVDEILPYKPFMTASGGGLTVTGGEPLLQSAFLTQVFRELREEGIHCCLDTNGYTGKCIDDMDDLLDQVDLVLLDLKAIDDKVHKHLVGVSNRRTLDFARHLSDIKQTTWIRHVVVPGYNDSKEDIQLFVDFVADLNCVEKVELLPYHELGKHKWTVMGDAYSLSDVVPQKKSDLNWIKDLLEAKGLTVQL